MNEIAGLAGVFIRSMATHGALGGLSAAIFEAVDIADAAGYDLIIIETVGVGQDEVDIVTASHTVVVVSAPGLGDDVQAMKAGILEIADIHVVSKADKPDSSDTARAIREMVMLMSPSRSAGTWVPPVLCASAAKLEGVAEIVAAIGAHRAHLLETGSIAVRVRSIVETRVLKSVDSVVKARYRADRAGAISCLFDRVVQRDLAPHDAALNLLRIANEGDDDDEHP
jgi:LAO/AO transport system kinase